MVTVLAIQHVQLAMPRGAEEAARAFYSGVLGLVEVAKPANLASRGGVWFERGDVRVHLGVEDSFRPARKAHVALLMEDIGPAVEAASALGCEVAHDEPLTGFERVYVYDPFGNRLEFMRASDSFERSQADTTNA